jgi:type IV secretion system protein VirB10
MYVAPRLALPFALCFLLAAQDSERNFNGKWRLDEAASVLRSNPAPPALLEIAHTGASIKGSAEGWMYMTDGSESRAQMGSSSISSRTKWEGRALLINSIVSGPRNYTMMDRWMLSNDRNTLRIRRQIVGMHGETESTFVYRREGVAAPATAPTAIAEARPAQPEPIAIYQIEAGTKIPLKLTSTISTKNSSVGDRIYLETAVPVTSEGRIVIPVGSFVAGTVTQIARAGRVKGRSELYLRFDSLTLPNGVSRDFRSRPGALDGDTDASLDRKEGTIRGESDKGGDARKVGEATAAGASVGAIGGVISGRPGMGVGIGAAGGAAAGLVGVLLSRGPDVTLPKGTVFEMVLDRALRFRADELGAASSHYKKSRQGLIGGQGSPLDGFRGLDQMSLFVPDDSSQRQSDRHRPKSWEMQFSTLTSLEIRPLHPPAPGTARSGRLGGARHKRAMPQPSSMVDHPWPPL